MAVEVAELGERLVALAALERALAGMRAPVREEAAIGAERSAARLALEGLLTGMCVDVVRQAELLGERRRTKVTLEGPLAGVCAQVTLQAIVLPEGRTTLAASERTVSGALGTVGATVTHEEILLTHLFFQFNRTIEDVGASVPLQVGALVKRRRADAALIRSLVNGR